MRYIFYVSRSQENVDPEMIGSLIRQARYLNEKAGITGMLSFDGEQFLQLFEGEAAEVAMLWERIRKDERHCDVRLLCEGEAGNRYYQNFSMGYFLNDSDDGLFERLRDLGGTAALEVFLNTREKFETL